VFQAEAGSKGRIRSGNVDFGRRFITREFLTRRFPFLTGSFLLGKSATSRTPRPSLGAGVWRLPLLLLFLGLVAPISSAPTRPDDHLLVGERQPDSLLFLLRGPNDGEPLERNQIPIEVETNFAHAAILDFYVEGALVARSTFSPETTTANGAAVSPELAAGVLRTIRQQIDVSMLQRVLRRNVLDPDHGPIEVRVHLTDAASQQLVTRAAFHSHLGNPWLEFIEADWHDEGLDAEDEAEALAALLDNVLEFEDFGEFDDEFFGPPGWRPMTLLRRQPSANPFENQASGGLLVPPGSLGALPHLPVLARYFVIATADDREELTRLPSDPRFLNCTDVLLAGVTPRAADGRPARLPVWFPAWSRRAVHVQSHIVLWTFAHSTGWTRSPIYGSDP